MDATALKQANQELRSVGHSESIESPLTARCYAELLIGSDECLDIAEGLIGKLVERGELEFVRECLA